MREQFHKALLNLAREDKRVVLIGSDLGVGAFVDFQREFPDRCFMEGVSEQALVGICAGLASCGFHPFLQTIATFLTRRAYEQIYIDLGLQRVPVRLIGAGGGVVYSRLGPTHTAIEDLHLMRSIPGIKVLAPMCPAEAVHLLHTSKECEGPIYFRLSKGPYSQVLNPRFPALGEATALCEGDGPLITATGLMSSLLLKSLESLKASGIAPALLHFPCIEPLDKCSLKAHLMGRRIVIVVEEHLRTGGLGTAIGETLLDLGWSGRFHHIGLPKNIADFYGNHFEVLEQIGLTSQELAQKIHNIFSYKL